MDQYLHILHFECRIITYYTTLWKNSRTSTDTSIINNWLSCLMINVAWRTNTTKNSSTNFNRNPVCCVVIEVVVFSYNPIITKFNNSTRTSISNIVNKSIIFTMKKSPWTDATPPAFALFESKVLLFPMVKYLKIE